MLRCDFVIAADDAEFGFPEVRLGVPTIVGAMRLPGRVGWSNAMEMLLTGDRVDARAAKDMGIVWKVVERDGLMDAARELAQRLVAGAPLAQRATKEMAARGAHLPWEDALRLGESMRRVVGATEDAAAGMRAARDGETPSWQGR